MTVLPPAVLGPAVSGTPPLVLGAAVAVLGEVVGTAPPVTAIPAASLAASLGDITR